MTIAVDIATGRVIGQVPERLFAPTAENVLAGAPCYAGDRSAYHVVLLTADGYVTVPAASVRLEKV